MEHQLEIDFNQKEKKEIKKLESLKKKADLVYFISLKTQEELNSLIPFATDQVYIQLRYALQFAQHKLL